MNTAQKINACGFDIALLGDGAAPVEKTHTVSVLFDDEGEHLAGFEIVGKNSEQYRAAVRETSVGAIKRSVQKNKQIDAKTSEGAQTLFDLGEDRNLAIAMAVVVGLPGFVDQGAPVAATPAFLKTLFGKFPSWQDKVLAALEGDANFLAI